jgi:hypothetical protein
MKFHEQRQLSVEINSCYNITHTIFGLRAAKEHMKAFKGFCSSFEGPYLSKLGFNASLFCRNRVFQRRFTLNNEK